MSRMWLWLRHSMIRRYRSEKCWISVPFPRDVVCGGENLSAPKKPALSAGHHPGVTCTSQRVCNGVGFGVAYVILFRRPGPLTGMVWGVCLELCMAFLYPSWLRITQLNEFLGVSAFGHVIYGAVLGVVARQMLKERQRTRIPVYGVITCRFLDPAYPTTP